MDAVLYLNAAEMALFKTLPASVQSAWVSRVKEEILTAYETPQQMEARMKAVNYDKYPEAKALIEQCAQQMKAGKAPDVSMANFPEQAIDAFLFALGASGISFLMESLMQDPKVAENAEAMAGIAALSRVRHETLDANQKVFA